MLSQKQMRAEISAYYAAGHPVPPEIKALPNPQRVNLGAAPVKGDASVKCMRDGEPITVKHRVQPVPGTVREAVAGEFKGGTIKHPDQAGECPECRGYVPLSGKGFVTAHTRGNAPAPASVELSERSTPPADTGAQVGDPDAAERRRAVDVDGAYERGTVRVPVPQAKGRPKLTEVPATVDNLRTAFEYWTARKPRSEAGKADQVKNVMALARRLEAARRAEVVDVSDAGEVSVRRAPGESSMHAEAKPDGRARSAPLTGAPLVKGRTVPTMAGEVSVRQVGDAYVRPAPAEDTRTGWEGRAGTMAGPLGRERLDRIAQTVPEPKRRRTASERRRYRRAQAAARQGS